MGTAHLFNFSGAQITRFQQEAETKFVLQRNCIVSRTSLALVAGTAEYVLPDYIQSIKRVTYLGWEVFPLEHRQLRAAFLSGTQQSRPYWYIINTVPTSNGAYQIKFFPVPSLSVAAISGYSALWGPSINAGLIIEYFRSPDFTSSTLRAPAYFMDKLKTMYASKRCYAIDGTGQSLKTVKFWNDKYTEMESFFDELMDDMNNKPRNLIASDSSSRPYGYTPPPPILPQTVNSASGSTSQANQFGISTDELDW
jgi:hypothetical protein